VGCVHFAVLLQLHLFNCYTHSRLSVMNFNTFLTFNVFAAKRLIMREVDVNCSRLLHGMMDTVGKAGDSAMIILVFIE